MIKKLKKANHQTKKIMHLKIKQNSQKDNLVPLKNQIKKMLEVLNKRMIQIPEIKQEQIKRYQIKIKIMKTMKKMKMKNKKEVKKVK